MDIKKYEHNPILTKNDVPFRVNSIFNPGAVHYNGEYLLLCRVEMPDGKSSFVTAKSQDGINFEVDSKPCLTPIDHGDYYSYVEWGIEDPRITEIDDKYYLTYTGYSKFNPLVILSETKDFKEFKIHGPVSEPTNKDALLFPERINGFYWKIDRPSDANRKDMWINCSPDLIHWGQYRILTEPIKGTWENDRIGGSTPPVKTNKGWLLLYHGMRILGAGVIYKIGVMLLDSEKPWIVIGRSKEPIIIPEFDYERLGDVGNVVFTNGWIVDKNGDVKIFYSGADTNICLATTSVDYLLNICGK